MAEGEKKKDYGWCCTVLARGSGTIVAFSESMQSTVPPIPFIMVSSLLPFECSHVSLRYRNVYSHPDLHVAREYWNVYWSGSANAVSVCVS